MATTAVRFFHAPGALSHEEAMTLHRDTYASAMSYGDYTLAGLADDFLKAESEKRCTWQYGEGYYFCHCGATRPA